MLQLFSALKIEMKIFKILLTCKLVLLTIFYTCSSHLHYSRILVTISQNIYIYIYNKIIYEKKIRFQKLILNKPYSLSLYFYDQTYQLHKWIRIPRSCVSCNVKANSTSGDVMELFMGPIRAIAFLKKLEPKLGRNQ